MTATGGAWNASIVAEVASWGKDKLVADGLGAYIAQVTEKGDQPAIYFSIMVMALFVVVINRVALAPALRPGRTQVQARLTQRDGAPCDAPSRRP